MLADNQVYYGLLIKPEDGLQDIRFLWSKRRIDSYSKLEISPDKSLWRDCRSGAVKSWNQKMISGTAIQGGLAIENYVPMALLPVSAQQKLALEQISKLQGQIIALRNSLLSKKTRVDTSCEKITNLGTSLMEEIKLYPGVLDIEEVLNPTKTVLPDFIEATGAISIISSLLELFDQYRFNQLNTLAKASDWAENCKFLHEIQDNKLFRFAYDSFEDYCKSIKMSSGSKRAKIGKLIARLNDSNLPIPLHRGQAAAIAEIPYENQIKVWEEVLARTEQQGQKITAITTRQIVETHRKLINQQVVKSQYEDVTGLINKLDQKLKLINMLGIEIEIPKHVVQFIDGVKRNQNTTCTEAKMLRGLLNSLDCLHTKQATKQQAPLGSFGFPSISKLEQFQPPLRPSLAASQK